MPRSMVWRLVLLAAAPVWAQPAAVVGPAVTPPLDPTLTQGPWAAAPWQGGFHNAGGGADDGDGSLPAAVPTRFKVLHDAYALYIGVECAEPNLAGLKRSVTNHDGNVWADDCIELFLDPAGEGRYYHHFLVNAAGVWFDEYGADYGLVKGKQYDLPLRVAAAVDEAAKCWRVVLRIPLAGLQLRPDAGSTWLFNVTRERQAGGRTELSSWAPLRGNFAQPRLFGKLTGLAFDYPWFAFECGEPRVAVQQGQAVVAVSLRNASGQPRRLAVGLRPFGGPDPGVTSEPFNLAPGAARDVTLPPLPLPAGAASLAAELTVTDVAAGQPAKVLVKTLVTTYRPLAIRVLSPVYRQCLFASEPATPIVCDIDLAADLKPRLAQVRYELLAADGRVAASVVRPAATTQATLPAADLPVGDYRLTAQALDAAGAAVAEAATPIRKLPPPAHGNEVRIDARGNVLVDGRPKVFLGWYGSIPLTDPRADVVALQNLETPVVVSAGKPEGLRQRFAEHGIYSIVSIEPGRLYFTFDLWRQKDHPLPSEPTRLSELSEECKGYLRRLVEMVRDEPGLLGYYLADEPEINNARADWLEACYRYMQTIDPYHPVLITNDTMDGLASHGYRACDILSPDPYSPQWDYVPSFLERAHSLAPAGKGLMLTPWHSSGQTHFNVPYGEQPPYSYDVTRSQMLVGVALGCRGFTGYTDAFFLPEVGLRYGLPPIWRTIRWLEPAMAGEPVAVTVQSDAPVVTWCRQVAGKLYLIVANTKPGERTVRIESAALAGTARLDVVAEGRQVAVKDGVFSERFAEGDCRIYTNDLSGRELATTAQVNAELTRQAAATVKPGNLLHVSRGVRARASAGFYAPWFEQFHYYAINGITDDPGWYLSHAGDQPGTLDLTLPTPATIGRVVLYTPNLADYDLLFQAPDGSRRLAEVRGNRATVAEHRFDPPVPTLKLRLTTRATRPGSEPHGAMVREIEAYQDGGTAPLTPLKLVTAAPAAPAFVAPASETAGEPLLWRTDFSPFRTAEKWAFDGHDDQHWVLSATKLQAQPKPGGGIVLACTAPEGYSSMQTVVHLRPEYRWLQVKLSGIEGEGYRWTELGLSDGSGKPGFRKAQNTSRPGTYTVDLHALHADYGKAEATAYLALWCAGSQKQPDGSVKPGPRLTYDWLQCVRRPRNGLAVTLADGSPLPRTLKRGDRLLFRAFLDEPADDVTVETVCGSGYSPLPLNGEAGVTLVRTGARDGREWAGDVLLGPGTGSTAETGYPVVFRAVMAGGPLRETLACAHVKVEGGG